MPKSYTHYAHTMHHWALGVSLNNAKQRIRDSASSTTHQYGYQIIEFNRPITTDEIHVDPVNGKLYTKDGISTEVVYTHPRARKHLTSS